MKKKFLKLLGTSLVVFGMTISLLMSSSITGNDVNLCLIGKMAFAQGGEAATSTGECGTGWIYFCGYIGGVDHPAFYAYEGPWLA